jgi:hypothetical protein
LGYWCSKIVDTLITEKTEWIELLDGKCRGPDIDWNAHKKSAKTKCISG